jgi:hypothetical protein
MHLSSHPYAPNVLPISVFLITWMIFFSAQCYLYKVVQILPGQTLTCLQTNRPGHIWTTLYIPCNSYSKFSFTYTALTDWYFVLEMEWFFCYRKLSWIYNVYVPSFLSWIIPSSCWLTYVNLVFHTVHTVLHSNDSHTSAENFLNANLQFISDLSNTQHGVSQRAHSKTPGGHRSLLDSSGYDYVEVFGLKFHVVPSGNRELCEFLGVRDQWRALLYLLLHWTRRYRSVKFISKVQMKETNIKRTLPCTLKAK